MGEIKRVWIGEGCISCDLCQDMCPEVFLVENGLDCSVTPTHGDQEETADNGHFGRTCDHPLFVFNQFGDLEQCTLRPGNVHNADGWREVLEPVAARYRKR